MAITAPNHGYYNKDTWLRTFCRIAPSVFIFANLALVLVFAYADARVYFILAAPFFIFNAYLLTHVGIFSHKALAQISEADKKDFHREYNEKRRKLQESGQADHVYNWEDIIHYVIIPNYKEDLSTLYETIDSMAVSKMAKQIIIVLGMEEREVDAPEKAKTIISKYSASFKDVFSTHHPMGLDGEQAGKSSNESWAAFEIGKDVEKKGYNTDHVLISTCDADSNFHPRHYDYITMRYCLDKERNLKIYQGPMVNFMNFESVPAATKLLCTAVSLHEMACLADPTDYHIPFSSYSMSYNLVSDVGGWDGDVIPEDWHMYLKCFFATAGKVTVDPVPLPVRCYAVENESSVLKSLHDRFVQAKRHAWGVSELSYFLFKVIECFFYLPSSKRPPIIAMIVIFLKMLSLHYFGAFGMIFMILSGIVTQAYVWIPSFANLPVAESIGTTWSLLFKIHNAYTVVPLILTIYAQYKLVKIVIGPHYGRWYHVLQWTLHWILVIPFSNVMYAMIPELWAFFWFMFTDKLVYVVASKGHSAVAAHHQITIHGSNDDEEAVVIEMQDAEQDQLGHDEEIGDDVKLLDKKD